MKPKSTKDTIDLKSIFDRLTARWPQFLIGVMLFLAIAWVYLLLTPNLYQISAALQLKDQSLSEKGIGNEKFLSGLELLEDNSELEDEIGILSSVSMVETTVGRLGFTTSIFKEESELEFIGSKAAKEVYKNGLEIVLSDATPQILNTPVHITFRDNGRYTIALEAEEADVMDVATQSESGKVKDISLNKEMRIYEPFKSPYLSFQIKVDSAFEVKDGEAYFFVIRPLKEVTKEYLGKLDIARISKESNIVRITTNGTIPAKETDFINTLMEVYIQNDLQKKNILED